MLGGMTGLHSPSSNWDICMLQGTNDRSGRKAQAADADPLDLIRHAVSGMRFGAIQLTIHEGKLVQMEVTEKRRFT